MPADLDVLEGVGHHGDEHVEQQDDGHAVVGDEEQLRHCLREVLAELDLYAAGRSQREHGPEQRDVAREQPAAERKERDSRAEDVMIPLAGETEHDSYL